MTTITIDRSVVKQALEALEQCGLDDTHRSYEFEHAARAALRSALAQEQAEPDISRCPQCNCPADNGFDRSFPPSPYLCTKCMAEPVQMHPSQFAELIKGKETMIGVPVYWSEWPTKETQ